MYLIPAVLASAAVTLVLKAAGSSGNRYGVLLGNYLTCLCLALVSAIRAGVMPEPVTVLCGLIGGVLFVAGLVMMQKSIEVNGASLTGAFSKLGLLVPLALSILVFHEKLTWLRFAGILLSCAAMVLIHSRPDSGPSGKISTLLLMGALLGCGSGDAMAKIFEETGSPSQAPAYFLILFACASVITAVLGAMEQSRTKKPVTVKNLASGILVGIPNYFSASLLLGALNYLPALLVYPVCSAGSLVMILLLSRLFFKEELTRRAAAGIVMIIAALVLLNI